MSTLFQRRHFEKLIALKKWEGKKKKKKIWSDDHTQHRHMAVQPAQLKQHIQHIAPPPLPQAKPASADFWCTSPAVSLCMKDEYYFGLAVNLWLGASKFNFS